MGRDSLLFVYGALRPFVDIEANVALFELADLLVMLMVSHSRRARVRSVTSAKPMNR